MGGSSLEVILKITFVSIVVWSNTLAPRTPESISQARTTPNTVAGERPHPDLLWSNPREGDFQLLLFGIALHVAVQLWEQTIIFSEICFRHYATNLSISR